MKYINDNGPLKALALIFIAGLLLRIGYVLLCPQLDAKVGDSEAYTTIARNLVEQKGYLYDRKEADVFWAPGYSFFVAAIYEIFPENNAAVRVVQAILSALVIVLVYSICKTVFSVRIAIVAAIITCVYPGFIGYAGLILSQTMAMFLITLFLAIIVRNSWNLWLDIALGAMLGFSVLTRSEMLLFYPVFFVLMILGSERRLFIAKHAIIIICIMASIVSVWTIRNYVVFRKIIPVNAYLGDVLWISTWKEEWLDWKAKEPALSISRGKSQVEASEAFFKEGVKNIKDHPFIYAKMCFKRLYRLWITGHSNTYYYMTDSLRAYLDKGQYLTVAVKLGMLVGNIVIVVSGFLGIGRAIWRKRAGSDVSVYLLMMPVFFYVAMHFFIFATPRYSIPIMPFMIIFASYFFLSHRAYALREDK